MPLFMDLNTITEVLRPANADVVKEWQTGYALLAGGTWLFSEPQVATHTLIDLESFKWPSLATLPEGLEIAATCKVVELDRFTAPPEWKALRGAEERGRHGILQCAGVADCVKIEREEVGAFARL
jgi:hypothetical protein